MKPLRALLPLALVLSALAGPLRAAPQSVEELLARIERERDATDVQLFKKLTGYGDQASFAAMQRAVRALSNENVLQWAYEAFESYRGAAGLEREAIEYLAEESDASRAENRRAAAAGLVKFGLAGEPELRRLLEKSKDEVVRARVLGPLLPKLVEQGDGDALETILDNAWLSTTASRAQLLGAARGFAGDAFDAPLIERVGDKKYPELMKTLWIEALAERQGPEVVPALVKALKDKSPSVQYAALAALDRRGETAHARELQKLARSKDAAVRRLAVVSLSKVMGTDAGWWRELVSMSQDDDPATRQGAAVALAELRTPEALELLYGRLLGDPDRAVRAEALQYVGNLRRKDSIAPLIGRINAESGRLKRDLLTVLRLITAEDHGASYERWKRWWDAEGAAFEVPPYEQALRAERERAKKAEEGHTVTSFYGLQVVSDRIAFVLDTSGSMKADTPAGKSRIEVAKDELAQVLAKYPDGDLFNLVFFSTDVYPWQDALVAMDAKARKAALDYVGRQNADGFTAVYDALKLAFEDPRVDTIVLLTDGTPYKGTIDDPDEIRAEVARWNSTRHVRIHCVSVGGDNPLLRELAKDTGGDYKAVQ